MLILYKKSSEKIALLSQIYGIIYMWEGGEVKMYKAYKQRVNLKSEQKKFLLSMMHISKNLYNQALYNVRQHFFKTDKYLSYNKNYKLLKDSENYKLLSSTQAQMVIRKVDEAMKAFFGSLKAGIKDVRLPRYLKKDGLYPLFDRMVYKPDERYYVMPRSNFIKMVNNDIKGANKKLSKHTVEITLTEIYLNIKTPKYITNKEIKALTIKPVFDGRYIEVIYVYKDDVKVNSYKGTETMGIDFGYKNLATLATTNNRPLIVDGNELKSYNQWTKSIPLARLRDRIIYLAKENNIKTKVINEAYTSVSSYLDKDPLIKSEFSGKRIKRGLYQSKNGTLINADLNAALNMIRKSNPDALWIGNRGLNTPKRVYLFN